MASEARQPSQRYRGLSHELIVETALELLDREGLDSFSMRGLAQVLDVRPSALYVHVSDRETVLAAAVGLLLSEVGVPASGLRLPEWLAAFARSYRRVLHVHAGSAPLVSGQLVSNGAQDYPLVEAVLAALHRAGYEGERLVRAYDHFMGWLVGFVGLELAPAPAISAQWPRERARELRTVSAELFPTIAAHKQLLSKSFAIRWKAGDVQPMDEAFEWSLQLIVDGLAARAARPRSGRGEWA